MTSRIRIRQFLAVSALALFGPMASAELPPDARVKATTEEVLAAVAATRDRQALHELADAKVVPHFDFRRMTQLATGRAWAQASPAQQEALTEEFRQLLVRTYTSALAAVGHTRARVAVQPARVLANGAEALVKTTVAEDGRPPVAIDYRMAKTPQGWKVYDVAVQEVSLVTNYRGSFAAQVDRDGIDGLIRALAEKNRSGARTG